MKKDDLYLQSRIEKILVAFMSLLIPIFVLPKNIQLVVLIIFVLLIIKRTRSFHLDNFSIYILAYIAIYALSIIINSMKPVAGDRIFASINTIAIWIIGLFFYLSTKNLKIGTEKINKIIFVNSSLIIILSILFLLHKNGIFTINNWLMTRVSSTDWINGVKTTRFNGLMEYPNLVSLYFLILMNQILEYIQKKKWIIKIIFPLLIIVPLFASGSRSGMIIGIAEILLHYYAAIKSKKINKKTLEFIKFIGIIFISIIIIPLILDFLVSLLNAREGSNTMREDIYRTSISAVDKCSILIGCGIKTMYYGYPLGSHSTFIGAYYKTGILGLIILLISFITLVSSRLRKGGWSNDIIYTVLLFIMLVFEDIDGANWLLILFFICQSMYLLKARTDRNHSISQKNES